MVNVSILVPIISGRIKVTGVPVVTVHGLFSLVIEMSSGNNNPVVGTQLLNRMEASLTIRVVSNIYKLESGLSGYCEIDVVPIPQRKLSILTVLRLFLQSYSCNYFLINCDPRSVFLLALCKYIFPFNPCRIISLDCVLRIPESRKDRIAQFLKRIVFRKVHLFIEYFRDTSGYSKYYGIPASKFIYVPFKINSYEIAKSTEVSDGDYIFCGGKTLRDFETLIEAMRQLPYRLRIVTMSNSEIEMHGSFLNEADLPPNVEVVRHDGAPETFYDLIAGSLFAVLPIKSSSISASGIGVCLACMAMRKCVVISSGPTVNGIIDEDLAVIVPPGDSQSLKRAIVKVAEDDSFRQTIADNGYAYARGLKDEKRLIESVVACIISDAKGGFRLQSGI